MARELLVSALLSEIRIAVLEEGRLFELWVDEPERERLVGNVYVGRIKKIVQGLNAAFLDIGLQQDAFLHFSDVVESLEGLDAAEEDTESKAANTKVAAPPRPVRATKANGRQREYPTFWTRRSGRVTIPLEPQQRLIVQVMRDAYAEKGVRVTTHVTIPGHYFVLAPFDTGIGVSHKITDEEERQRLRRLVRQLLPGEYGCIVRTAAQGQDAETLQRELRWLLQQWNQLEQQARRARSPQLLHREPPLYIEAVREFLAPELQRILVDARAIYREIRQYLQRIAPQELPKLELYTDKEPLFDRFGIEAEVERLYQRRVPLPAGGSIVIDHTEAMVVIDVNAGRGMYDASQELNALRTNLEAAREIARQVRLRDIGGIILVDFIDLQQERHRQQVYEELKRELARDRAKTVIYPMTHLGMLPFTRQRTGRSIVEKLSEPCPTCQGSGRLYAAAVLLNSIERWLRNFRTHSREWRLRLAVHPRIARQLCAGIFSRRLLLMLRYRVWLHVVPDANVPADQFRMISLRRNRDVTQEYRS